MVKLMGWFLHRTLIVTLGVAVLCAFGAGWYWLMPAAAQTAELAAPIEPALRLDAGASALSPRPTAAELPTPKNHTVVPPATTKSASVKPRLTPVAVSAGVSQSNVPNLSPNVNVGAAFPRKGHLQFSLYMGSLGIKVAQVDHAWQVSGENYRLSSITEPSGLAALAKSKKIRQESAGTLDSNGLKPKEFVAYRKNQDEVSERASFDWSRNRVILTTGDHHETEVLQPGSQDFATAWYQLSLLAKQQQQVSMMVATGKTYKKMHFSRGAAETVQSPLGTVSAVPWRSAPQDGDDRIEIWLASEHGNMPVRIRYTDSKGNTFDQLAVKIDLKN